MAQVSEIIDDGGAQHLVPGFALPAIALPATSSEQITLADRSGRSIVYCYSWTGRPGLPDPPNWDDIPGAHGSTPQTEGYRDLYDELSSMDVAVFGLSLQTTDYQKEMVARLNVPFPVLSDHHQEFTRALDLPMFETGSESYLKRLTMILRDGCIETVFYPVPQPAQDAANIMRWLRR